MLESHSWSTDLRGGLAFGTDLLDVLIEYPVRNAGSIVHMGQPGHVFKLSRVGDGLVQLMTG